MTSSLGGIKNCNLDSVERRSCCYSNGRGARLGECNGGRATDTLGCPADKDCSTMLLAVGRSDGWICVIMYFCRKISPCGVQISVLFLRHERGVFAKQILK